MKELILFILVFLPVCVPKTPDKPDFLRPAVQFFTGDCFRQGSKLVHQGSAVEPDDTLLTAYNGKIHVVLNDSDYFVISENSKVVLWYSASPVIVKILVLRGKVYSNAVVLPKMGIYKVYTRKVEAFVSGTAFSVDVGDTDRTVIDVLEGIVNVTDYDSLCPINVRGGDHAIINPGKFPCKIRNIGLQELKDLVNWIGQSWMRLRKIEELRENTVLVSKLKECDVLPKQITFSAVSFSKKEPREIKPKPDFDQVPKAKPREFEYRELRNEALREPAEIARVINGNKGPINRLYNKHLRKSPFKGRVLIRFSIVPSGTVTEPVIISTSTNTPEFDESLMSLLQKIRFKAISDSAGQISVVFPFDFVN